MAQHSEAMKYFTRARKTTDSIGRQISAYYKWHNFSQLFLMKYKDYYLEQIVYFLALKFIHDFSKAKEYLQLAQYKTSNTKIAAIRLL